MSQDDQYYYHFCHHYECSLPYTACRQARRRKEPGKNLRTSRCRATGMSRAHNLGLGNMAPLAWLAADCPRLPAPDCVWLLEGSRVDAGLVCGMTLIVTVHEVAGRYLAGGWWIRRESGMERRAHRLAAIVKGLSTLSRSSSCIMLSYFPGRFCRRQKGVGRSTREAQFTTLDGT